MSDYTKSTDFASKDALASGNAAKIVKGTEIDTEFNNIAIAVATKADSASPSFSGTVSAATISVTTLSATNISGGTISGITDLSVADGGTGASTAANARANLGTVADTAANGIAARTSANTLTARTITAGTGISVSNGTGASGNPTITNAGVTSLESATGDIDLENLTVFDRSISANGYQKLPGGLIIQWGVYSSTADGAETFNWVTNFSSACFVVLGSWVYNVSHPGSRTYPVGIGTVSTTGFTVDRNPGVDGTVQFRWIAIGQ